MLESQQVDLKSLVKVNDETVDKQVEAIKALEKQLLVTNEAIDLNRAEIAELTKSEKQATEKAIVMQKAVDELNSKLMIAITEQS